MKTNYTCHVCNENKLHMSYMQSKQTTHVIYAIKTNYTCHVCNENKLHMSCMQ